MIVAAFFLLSRPFAFFAPPPCIEFGVSDLWMLQRMRVKAHTWFRVFRTILMCYPKLVIVYRRSAAGHSRTNCFIFVFRFQDRLGWSFDLFLCVCESVWPTTNTQMWRNPVIFLSVGCIYGCTNLFQSKSYFNRWNGYLAPNLRKIPFQSLPKLMKLNLSKLIHLKPILEPILTSAPFKDFPRVLIFNI